ncbi:DrmB family protein [Nocardia beijingensis]
MTTPADTNPAVSYIYDESQTVDPLGDVDKQDKKGVKKNRAKVGSARPSSLLYTYGPGSVMDLPNFTIMPMGLDEWDIIWDRRATAPVIHAPRLKDAVRTLLRSRDVELRPFPRQANSTSRSTEGKDLGVPARVFPQWLRCTGCDLLAPLDEFQYSNTHPYRPDLAAFEHAPCPGRRGEKTRFKSRPTTPARYLLACAYGHVDEFPYQQWVHRGRPCAKATHPTLKMSDRTTGKGGVATITCTACEMKRAMNEAQGELGRERLPKCRGRHPHLDAFAAQGCGADLHLILVGASNLWFPVSQSVIVMPESSAEHSRDLADRIRLALGEERLGKWITKYRNQPEILRDFLSDDFDLSAIDDSELVKIVDAAAAPPAEPTDEDANAWDPVDLLVPEWRYLQRDPLGDGHSDRAEDEASGLTLSARDRGPHLPARISRILAVESLRKVNALVGFTRIDEFDRVDDVVSRMVRLTRKPKPRWTVATVDRGEGIFIQLDESAVAAWEAKIRETELWGLHRKAHERNYRSRTSDTADNYDPDRRFRPPRYWLVHSFAHILIRELAMTCGYNAASLSERLYAWPAENGRPPAAGLLICTTASDSDGTLGGLVEQSRPDLFEAVVNRALRKATRCASDPICANRTPQDPEEFLHGAACHCCVMASETSCERSNRFLDRRFLIDLPGHDGFGFFPHPE